MLFILGVFAVMLFLGHAGGAHAVETTLLTPNDAPDEVPSDTGFREAIVNFLNFLLTFLGLIAIAFIIYAGFLFIVAGGDEEQVGKAKKIIIYAGIGIIVILLSYAIVEFFVSVGLGAGGA